LWDVNLGDELSSIKAPHVDDQCCSIVLSFMLTQLKLRADVNVNALLTKKLDQTDSLGRTLLHLEISRKHFSYAELLLENGADPTIKSQSLTVWDALPKDDNKFNIVLDLWNILGLSVLVALGSNESLIVHQPGLHPKNWHTLTEVTIQ
jgi:hypothetical protein